MTKKRMKEIDRLADAILRYREWRHNQLVMKQERRIKAMLTRQRNLRLRNHGKLRLP